MMPISIIVPIYNSIKYLEDTVKTILTQSFTDFELILVDDGSNDGSSELCDLLSKKDERIKVVHKKNGGVSSARNAGIDIAIGDYICFIDADDGIENNMLEVLYNNAVVHNVDISCCGLIQKTLEGVVDDQYCSGETNYFINNEELIVKFFDEPIYREVLYGPYNKIIKSEIVKSVRFNEKFTIAEDLLFNFECIEKMNSFYFENIGLYYYIKRPNSISTSSFSTKCFDYIYVADILLKKCEEKYNFAYNSALYFTYINKQNMWRSLSKHNELKKAHKKFYDGCKSFCKKYVSNVWTKLPMKRKIDYIVLNIAPFLYKFYKF